MSEIILKSASFYSIDKNNGHCFVRISYQEARNILFIPKTNTETTGNMTELFNNMIDYTTGYQRLGNLSRMKKFAEYLEENQNVYVPPIIISSRGNWEFIPEGNDQNTGYIKIHERGAVIDGQHRLGGFLIYCSEKQLFENYKLNCEVILNINNNDEMELFKTINKTQRGVDISHLTNLTGKYQGELNIPEATAIKLANDRNSPLKGFIKIEQGIPGLNLFTLSTVAKEIKLFSSSSQEFKFTDITILSQILFDYWKIIKNLHNEEWNDSNLVRNQRKYKLLETTGLIVLTRFAGAVLQRAIKPRSLNTIDEITVFEIDWHFVEKILINTTKKIDWEKKGTYENATGNVGANLIYKDLENNFRKYMSTDEYKQFIDNLSE